MVNATVAGVSCHYFFKLKFTEMIKIGSTYILYDGEEVQDVLKASEINKATNIITIAKNSEGNEVVVINKLKYRQIAVPMSDHLIVKTLL